MTVEELIASKLDFQTLGGRLQSLDRKLSYFTADGHNAGFPAYPAQGEDEIAEIGLTAIAQDLSLSGRTHAMSSDRRFTAEGRNSELDPHRGASLTVLALASDQLVKHEQSVLKTEAGLFTPAPIERGDFESAIADREIRDYWRGLKGKELEQARQTVANGSAARLLLALVRSPLPIGESDAFVRRTWSESIARSHPVEVAQLERQKASLDWAKLVTGQVAHRVAKLSGWAPQRVYEHVAPTGGWRIFGIQPADAANWDALITARKSNAAA